MELLISNKYIKDYLKGFPTEKHHQLLENVLIIGIDLIKKIYDPSELLQKLKKISSNIVRTEYSNIPLQDPTIKEDIIKIQEEISKLNSKFEHEMRLKKQQRQPNIAHKPHAADAKKKQPPFRTATNIAHNESQKNFLTCSITPKITEIQHAFIKKPSPFHTKHHLDDTEMRKVFKTSNNFQEDAFQSGSSHEKKSLKIKKSASPPQKLPSPDSQRTINHPIPRYLKKVDSKIKEIVNHHKKLNTCYKKYKGKNEKNIDDEDNLIYSDYLSNSQHLSSEKTRKNKQMKPEREFSSHNSHEDGPFYNDHNNDNKNNNEGKNEERNMDTLRSPNFLKIDSQYIDKESHTNNNSEISHLKPRVLEFSSQFNTRYNNGLTGNEVSSEQKRTTHGNDIGGVKKEQSKLLMDTRDFEFVKSRENFKYTTDNFNNIEKESSISSNFSLFQPNEELKSFYQKELWNNHSFQQLAEHDGSPGDEGGSEDGFE